MIKHALICLLFLGCGTASPEVDPPVPPDAGEDDAAESCPSYFATNSLIGYVDLCACPAQTCYVMQCNKPPCDFPDIDWTISESAKCSAEEPCPISCPFQVD